MQLAEPACLASVEEHAGRAAGMQCRMFGALEARCERTRQRLEVRLDVEEVDRARLHAPLLFERRAISCRADAHRLAQPAHGEPAIRRLRVAHGHPPDLEDTDALDVAR